MYMLYAPAGRSIVSHPQSVIYLYGI